MATFFVTFLLLWLPAVIATMLYYRLGGLLGDILLGLKRAVLAPVNVPAGIWVLAHGHIVPGTAMLGVGLGVGITAIEPLIDPLPRWLRSAQGWTLAIGGMALVILFVQIALGYYPAPPAKRAVHPAPASSLHLDLHNGPQPRELSGSTIAVVLFVLMIPVPLVLSIARTKPSEA